MSSADPGRELPGLVLANRNARLFGHGSGRLVDICPDNRGYTRRRHADTRQFRTQQGRGDRRPADIADTGYQDVLHDPQLPFTSMPVVFTATRVGSRLLIVSFQC